MRWARIILVSLAVLLATVAVRPDLASAVAAWALAHPGAPFIACAGDSIVEGYTNWLTILDAGPSGNTNGDIMQVIGGQSSGLVVGTNFGKSGAAMAYTQGAVDNLAAPLSPRYVLVHVGVNDINGGTVWTNVFFNHMLAKCKLSNAVMILDQVWPWKSSLSAQISTWNAASLNWVTTNTTYTNGLYLLATHDPMANPTNNVVLYPPYTWDTQHPTILGTSNYTSILLALLNSIEGGGGGGATNRVSSYISNRVTIGGHAVLR